VLDQATQLRKLVIFDDKQPEAMLQCVRWAARCPSLRHLLLESAELACAAATMDCPDLLIEPLASTELHDVLAFPGDLM
jgi:hypothetical protein